MRTVIVNVGLETGAEYGEVKSFSEAFALESLDASLRYHKEGSLRLMHKVEQSNSELTLVVTIEVYGDVSSKDLATIIERTAQYLKQEAIAYYVVEEQKGYLVGEYKENWGNEFNPEYFLI